MNIKEIIINSIEPPLYEKGTSEMWTDEYISQQMLEVHINPELDLASRKKTSIEKTTSWILQNADEKELNILDLGCGPGLYTEILAQKGHKVSGLDFSKHSIEYAKKSAERKNLDITYIRDNYLDYCPGENIYDLVILIYTDFGVLNPEERDKLLNNICKILKPGGIFIFDVLNDNSIEDKIEPKNWEVAEKGFWKNEPYLALSESFFYKKDKVALFQHIIMNMDEDINIYRFWMHFFSHTDLTEILKSKNFDDLSFHEDVLPEGDKWNGHNITFCRAANCK